MIRKKYTKPDIEVFDLDKEVCLLLSSDPWDPIGPPGMSAAPKQEPFSQNAFDENPFE
ncbi:hypothetical protein [Carboxylicivirga marina]|uniref:Uncharacterized protein n=1 Tax=Carboxylicivirga marina TaxID=2800988 RepID=A0ABS1HR63_9BACT|nr:hypothetical protein [Carboxylicivirga marina]MBK3519990.1 hypothetical protein [Carboxylicivirga marina]